MLATSDQRDLLLPLFAGIRERPPWREFLRRLAARTGAQRAGLLVRGPGNARLDCWTGPMPAGPAALVARELLTRSRTPASLRPFRVYASSELLDHLDQAGRARAQADLAAAGIAHSRLMRIPASFGWEAWATLEHDNRDFAAADSALLSALGPHIAAALALLRDFDDLTHRAEIAEEALGTLGVSQALLDEDGRVVTGDPGRLGNIDARSGVLLQHSSDSGAGLADGMASMAQPGRQQAVVPGRRGGDRHLLLRHAPASASAVHLTGATVALTRDGSRSGAGIAEALRELFGLSAREADLAAALSRGAELVPAGVALGLTPGTARNYSKRIYAKTGTRGQADLVRLALSGIGPFAQAPAPPA